MMKPAKLEQGRLEIYRTSALTTATLPDLQIYARILQAQLDLHTRTKRLVGTGFVSHIGFEPSTNFWWNSQDCFSRLNLPVIFNGLNWRAKVPVPSRLISNLGCP